MPSLAEKTVFSFSWKSPFDASGSVNGPELDLTGMPSSLMGVLAHLIIINARQPLLR
jgi:hypothetical protein